MSQQFYDFQVNEISGKGTSLSRFKGKVLLVVNVASKCGLTPQYEALEKIYERYSNQGFEVLGFPANEFLAQEPGSDQEIQEFCTMKFGVKFPMFSKIVVKGEGQHPLYKFLTDTIQVAQTKPGPTMEDNLKSHGLIRENKKDILWNFEKFLIGRDGKVIARFSPDIAPDDVMITKTIEEAL